MSNLYLLFKKNLNFYLILNESRRKYWKYKRNFQCFFGKQRNTHSKNNTKVKLAISIISTILILAAITTLLIGYFKFYWFKSEIYKVDANITREVNQANFFSETKTIKTRIALEEGAYEEQNYEVNTDFMVYLKDRTQLKDNDYLNKASLVILNSTMTSNEGEQELPSFDIYDKKKVGEFESFPDGSKFPISSFSFYENGTIVDIKFPEFTDEYNGQILKELVEKVIPKLSRNRTEDNANGLNIKTRTDRKKKTLIEEEKPQQYLSFKGSKFSRTVQRDFEDDKLTDIKSKSDIVLVSTPEEDEKVFGVKEFYFRSESNIMLKEIKEGLIELGNILRWFNINFDLINNHDLLEI